MVLYTLKPFLRNYRSNVIFQCGSAANVTRQIKHLSLNIRHTPFDAVPTESGSFPVDSRGQSIFIQTSNNDDGRPTLDAGQGEPFT
jgi:hypothetical protein